MPARKTNSGDTSAASHRPRTGLLYWATCALAESRKAAPDLQPDPVHDLRVAIRRCRSLAEGLRTIDPVPGWKEFRTLPKPLFSALGELRDTQVLAEWLSSLTSVGDPIRATMSAALAAREAQQKLSARTALAGFNAKRWMKLAVELDGRARKLPSGSRAFRHLALERWFDTFRLHETAMRTRRDNDLHQLRIGIKRFRYTVENFLPDLHKVWSKNLKHMQDLLGEVHDLDVLLIETRQSAPTPNQADQFTARIQREREERISEYICRTVGADSLWEQWRAGLPSGRELSAAADAKLQHWSRVLDRDPAHSRRVAHTSVQLWRGLRRRLGWPFDRRATVLLRAAALLHNLGARKSPKKRLSVRSKMIGKLSVPIGWREDEMRIVRLASQYCSGPLPSASDPEFQALPRMHQQPVLRMAGILRLADALNTGASTSPELEVLADGGTVTVAVVGFDAFGAQALEIAAARHLLELSEGVPILVRAPVAVRPLAKSATAS